MSTILQSQGAALGCFCLSWDCYPLPLLVCLLRSREREQFGRLSKSARELWRPGTSWRRPRCDTWCPKGRERHLTRQQSNLYFISSNSWDMWNCVNAFGKNSYIARTKFSIFTFLSLMIKQFSSYRMLFGWNWQNIYFSVSAINRAIRAPSAAETAFSCRRCPPAFFFSFSLFSEPGFQQKVK